MSDRKLQIDSSEPPEDVATLYSWANLHGAKYRDFSASRAQTRERARQRVQEAIDSERRRTRDETEANKNADGQHGVELASEARGDRNIEDAIPSDIQPMQPHVAQRMWQSARPERVPNHPAAVMPPQPPFGFAQMQHQAQPGFASGQPAASSTFAPAQPAHAGSPMPQGHPLNHFGSPHPNHTAEYAPAREEQADGRVNHPRQEAVQTEYSLKVRNPGWNQGEQREAQRPAWLNDGRTEMAAQAVQQAPEDTLQGSRDRLTSRWFALKGVFAGLPAPAEALPAPAPQRAPVLAVFSLAGGVGKTSLVATLGRTLAARGEKVLLVDTAPFGLLPFFFGARDQRPGVLRTFTAPNAVGDAPVQLIQVDTEALGPETAPQESLTQEVTRHGRGVSRILIDLATASGGTTRRILRMGPTVLVPVIPDMSSVVSVSSIDAFFQHNVSGSGQQVRPCYVLNQFDPSLPLHLDVREVLREQLGDRLLPFALRRTPAVSEALAEGMTVVDYAPSSAAAEDFGSLAGWVKSLAAPAFSGYRGVRWSER